MRLVFARKAKRDFSLRRPATSQKRSENKRRRPAPLEMTVVGWGRKAESGVQRDCLG